MMPNRSIPIFKIVMLIILFVCAYWLYQNTEIEEYEKSVDRSAEARKNSLLAAHRLLIQHGFEFTLAENRNVFRKLDNSDTGLLWIHDISILQTREERRALKHWIENGGMLLASIDRVDPNEKDSPSIAFLSELGVEVDTVSDENDNDIDNENEAFEESEYEEEEEEEEYEDKKDYEDFFNLERNIRNAGLNPIILPELDGSSTTISVNSEYYLLSTNHNIRPNSADVLLDDESIIQLRIGDGILSLYGDYQQFDNEQIDELDTAFLLMWLTQPITNKKAITAFQLNDTPTLIKTIWANLSLAVVSFLVVLIGFLCHASARLGPIETEPVSNKSNLLAHLKARGTFWHKHKENHELTRIVKDAALHKLARRLGINLHALAAKQQPSSKPQNNVALSSVLSDAEQTQFARLAAQVAKCSERQAHTALFGTPKNNQQLLFESNVLQQILQAKSHTIKLNNINASST